MSLDEAFATIRTINFAPNVDDKVVGFTYSTLVIGLLAVLLFDGMDNPTYTSIMCSSSSFRRAHNPKHAPYVTPGDNQINGWTRSNPRYMQVVHRDSGGSKSRPRSSFCSRSERIQRCNRRTGCCSPPSSRSELCEAASGVRTNKHACYAREAQD